MATKKNITVNGVLTPVWQTDATAQQIDDAVVAAQNAVLYTAQSKTAAEQAQARGNIGAGSAEELAKKPDAQLTYTILHVAKTGSDETGDGSADRPFLTIQRALDSFPRLLVQDQVIQVSAGYYPEKLSIWGFIGGELTLTAEEGAEVSVDSITVGACANRKVGINGITLVGSTVEFPGNAFRVFAATMIELINITCTGTEATPQVGAFYLCNCPCLSIRNSSISNKGIALDVMGSIVYLNNTVTGVNNTVGIRCGSGWGSKGGYVQKGGATIAGEEQKGYGGQIW